MYCVYKSLNLQFSPQKQSGERGAQQRSSTMMALAFCDACEMKKIPLQSWCSSQEDLAAHALLEEMNLESSQGVGRERRRLNDDNTLAPRKDHRQPQLILRKLTVLDPTHLLKNTKFRVSSRTDAVSALIVISEMQMTRVLLSLFMALHRVVPGAQSSITTKKRFAQGKKATLPTQIRYVKLTQTAFSFTKQLKRFELAQRRCILGSFIKCSFLVNLFVQNTTPE